MKTTSVKQHIRTTKTGKLENVRRHVRNIFKEKEQKKEDEKKVVVSKPERIPGTTNYAGSKIVEKEENNLKKKGKKLFGFLDDFDTIKQEYEKKYPVTWEVMTKGKWKTKTIKEGNKTKKIKEIILSKDKYNQLVKENEYIVKTIAKRYSFGQNFGDRYDEAKSIGMLGMVEAINWYGNIFNPKNPQNLKGLITKNVYLRLKEFRNNRLKAGLRMPVYLQKPFEEYREVKRKLLQKYGRQPNTEELAKELQKKWTKATFYNEYKLAEERKYQIEKTFVKSIDKKTKKKILEKRLVTVSFNELPEKRKKEEKKKDILPLEGYVTVFKEGKTEEREKVHEKNINKIKENFDNERKKLEEDYELEKIKTPAERKLAEDFIKQKEKEVVFLQAKLDAVNSKKLQAMKLLEDTQSNLKGEIARLMTLKPLEKNKNELKKIKVELEKKNNLLSKLESKEYLYETVLPFGKDIKELNEKIIEANKDLKIAKEFYTPIDENVYQQRKVDIDRREKLEIENEIKRFNKDTSSAKIPGIYERIKEFDAYDSIVGISIHIPFEKDEGNSQIDNLILRDEKNLRPDELQELVDLHTFAKEQLKSRIQMLNPIHREIFSLYIGLHPDSPLKENNLWGKIATYSDIISYIDKKHKWILKNQDVVSEWLTKKTVADKKLYLNSLPYVLPVYRENPELFIKRLNDWQKKKPISGLIKKKIKQSDYNRLYKKFKESKKKAKIEWTKWRKKKGTYTQAESKKKYLEIKKKYKALKTNKPKKFFYVKKENKNQIKRWKMLKPKLFYNSNEGKQAFIRQTISTSTDIMRRITPIKVVRDLLGAHRRLVENGIVISKSFLDEMIEKIDFNFIKDLIQNNNIEILELE